MNKATGEIEVSGKVQKVRGASYIKIVIQECEKQIAALTSLATPSHIKQHTFNLLFSSNDTYKNKKTTEAIIAYQTALTEAPLPPPNNVAVNKTGYETTDHMKGMLPYSSLRVKHIDLVRGGFSFRGGIFDPKEKISVLSKRLKEMDMQQQRETNRMNNGQSSLDWPDQPCMLAGSSAAH